ncbi:related to AYR1 - NADPH-dependent 1-acyl dihydroxyacetone phosphate reductase [Melanopsichium pennsylvanicum]|uniref:Related to AYR1 - NADPH-dependent 1-acyl dihydroxyacetone phosphate reductase n=2 Tax=Melanopsichium pennsylvanicum TaxID=63383 RepID=A0AAJ4XJU7_9BASI|nr:short-chain dehydrogenase reductase family protein [Melanopsichium pennsylvanicum 4]SNX83662.1 related to AYR1 - NADPH-dependent 1-acyl dihydroxyacetone phosphate reductase [Melanopsichium pennsylvanicum]
MANLVTPNDPRQVVVITGCSSGLGRSMAIEFDAQKTYRVFATARNLDSIRQLPAGIERIQLDVTDPTSIKAAFKEITRCTGDRIDILINNAGVNLAVGPLVEIPIQNIRNTFEANFFGLIAVTQAAVPSMIRRRSGTVVNIGSTAAIGCMPFGAPYSASKAAVHAISDTLRLELAGFGIKVVVVAPGAIKSSIAENTSKNLFKPTAAPSSSEDGVDDLGYLPADSMYKHVEDLVKFRAEYSQKGEPTPSETFARNVRRWVAVANPGAYLFTGKKSLSVWISYYLPTRVKDWMIGRIFQTHRIGENAHKNKNI